MAHSFADQYSALVRESGQKYGKTSTQRPNRKPARYTVASEFGFRPEHTRDYFVAARHGTWQQAISYVVSALRSIPKVSYASFNISRNNPTAHQK